MASGAHKTLRAVLQTAQAAHYDGKWICQNLPLACGT